MLHGTTTKTASDFFKIRVKYSQMGEDYKLSLKEIQRLNKDLDEKSSKIKQQEVEISALQDQVASQRARISLLNKNESELSYYRGSSQSISNYDMNNELWANQHFQEQHVA
jgi:predicted nuclease with TOPRIM domain